MNWHDYMAEKLAPKPSYKRSMPRQPDPEPEPIIVEESFMDTVRMKALNFVDTVRGKTGL